MRPDGTAVLRLACPRAARVEDVRPHELGADYRGRRSDGRDQHDQEQGAAEYGSRQQIRQLPDTRRLPAVQLAQRQAVARVLVVEQQPPLPAAYAEVGLRAEVASFFDDIPRRISEAQLVVSRAGGRYWACRGTKTREIGDVADAGDGRRRRGDVGSARYPEETDAGIAPAR